MAGGSLLSIACVFALAALAAAFSLQDIVSWDYWWQLRTGALIWETGSVPDRDVFSYTARGAPYVDIHWLFQLGLHGVHALGGHAAVVVGKLAFVALTLGLLWPIGARRDRPALSAAALALTTVLLAERIMPRAELPSFALLAGLLLLLDRARNGHARSVYWIVPLQLVWANTHGLFAVGLAVVAIHLAGDAFERISRKDEVGRGIDRLLPVLLASVGASFLNPSGWRGVAYPFMQLGMIGSPAERALGATIVELQPTLGNASPTMVLAAGLLVAATAAVLVASRRAVPARDWLLLVAFVYLAIAARRNLALLGIVLAPMLVTHANAWLDARGARSDAPRARAGGWACVGVLLLLSVDVFAGGFHRRIDVVREPGLGIMRTWFSLGAAEWIAANDPPGPLAHQLADGGVLIWRLHPRYPVMIDGRLEVYGAERLERLQWSTPGDFLPLHRAHRFGTVVVHHSKVPSLEMLRWLQTRRAWKLVFVDEVSAVYVREGEGAARFVALDVDDDALFPSLVDEGRAQTELRARGRALFYAAMNRLGRARAAMAWASERYPDIAWSEPAE